MKVTTPITVTDAMLTTNVVNIEADWVAGTYNTGDRAVVDDSVYEALVTTNENPVGSAAWFRVGYDNQWRMFTEGLDSCSTRDGGITATISPTPLTTTVAVLGITGTACQVVLTDAIEGIVFDETVVLQDIGVLDWWGYYFTDYEQNTVAYFNAVPPYGGADLEIKIIAAGPTSPTAVGRVLFGIERDIGLTVIGVQTRLEDYSIKERDGFGNLTLMPRRTIRRVDYDFMITNHLLDYARQTFQSLAATPTLFVGDGDFPETITYGVYTNFQTISAGDGTITECSATIEEF